MKVFKFKFTKLTVGLIYAGIVICVAGVAANIISIIFGDIATAENKVYPIIQHSLMFFIPIFLLIILISLLISSYYAVEGQTLKLNFGIIRSKYDVNNIEIIILNRSTGKLTVCFKDENFMVISVKEEWYNDFIDALLKANRNIEFSIKSKENFDDNDDKKK